jgi:tetrahydromethanopterin S-methyltransferase subunit B
MFILPLERKSPAPYADSNSAQFLISAMSDDLPSRMIRVPTPLVDAVRELSRLHRQGRTKAVLEGIQKVITTIDSDIVIDIDSISETISKLTERLDRLEIQPIDSKPDIDIDSVTQVISRVSERLEKVESDVSAIALTIQDLSTRVSSLEGVGDIGYAVTPLSELEALFDSRSDIEMTTDLEDIGSDSTLIAQPLEPPDISTDSVKIAERTTPPTPPHLKPLSQLALAKHLSCRDKVVEKQRKQGKESFAIWSRERDPDGMT